MQLANGYDIPNIMKGIQLTGHGGLDKLVFRDDIPVVPTKNLIPQRYLEKIEKMY